MCSWKENFIIKSNMSVVFSLKSTLSNSIVTLSKEWSADNWCVYQRYHLIISSGLFYKSSVLTERKW